MLIDPDLKTPDAGMAAILAAIAGKRGQNLVERLDLGLYACGHWNFDAHLLGTWDGWTSLDHLAPPDQWFSSHGVCDSPAQFMDVLGTQLHADPGKYVVAFTQVRKADQPAEESRQHLLTL